MDVVAAVWNVFGPFVIPAALFALGLLGYALLYLLGRLTERSR